MNATHDAPRGQKTPPPEDQTGLLLESGPQRSDRTVLSVLAATVFEVVDSSAKDVEGLRHLEECAAHMAVVAQKQDEEMAA